MPHILSHPPQHRVAGVPHRPLACVDSGLYSAAPGVTSEPPQSLQSSATINFHVARGGRVNMKVNTLLGGEGQTPHAGIKEPGPHFLRSHTNKLSSGVCLQMTAKAGFATVRKTTLVIQYGGRPGMPLEVGDCCERVVLASPALCNPDRMKGLPSRLNCSVTCPRQEIYEHRH